MTDEQILELFARHGECEDGTLPRAYVAAFARAVESAARDSAIAKIEGLKQSHVAEGGGCTASNCEYIMAWDDAIRALREAKP